MKKFYFLLFICLNILKINALDSEKLNCLILLDKEDSENIDSTSRFYLMVKLQSAFAEQSRQF